jgi:hypothetical protein
MIPDLKDGNQALITDKNSAQVPVNFQHVMFSGYRNGSIFPVWLHDRVIGDNRRIDYVTTTRTQKAYQ